MKKSLVIAAGLTLVSTSAFATKARMDALQQATTGSYYISDSRSIFLNPAYGNDYSNYIVTEWGAAANSQADAATAPHAEGGFFRSSGNLNYGLYLGNQADSFPGTNGQVNRANYLERDNVLDLFVSGDAGLQWGLNVSYASSKDDSSNSYEQKHSSIHAKAGVIMGNIEAYAHATIKDESEGSSTQSFHKFEAELSPTIGINVMVRGWKMFLEVERNELKQTEGTAATPTESTYKRHTNTLGAGKIHKVNNKARLFTDVTLRDQKDSTGGNEGGVHNRWLAATFGYEADANSWLTLRGAVSGDLWGHTRTIDDKRGVRNNTVDVSAGATLNFGKLKVDGSIGTVNAAGTGQTDVGLLRMDTLMSRVGVHYWF